jgi:hypothetical protein
VGDLHCGICDQRHQLIQKSAGLFGAVWAVERDRRAHVDHDRHAVRVRGTEDGLELFDVLGVLELHVGVAEMHFDAAAQRWNFGASLKLFQGVRFERVEAAKRDEAFRIQGRLRSDPVVFLLHLFVFVLRFAARASVRVGGREQDRALDPGLVEQLYHIGRRDRRDLLENRHRRAEQMLVMIAARRVFGGPGGRRLRLSLGEGGGEREQSESERCESAFGHVGVSYIRYIYTPWAGDS